MSFPDFIPAASFARPAPSRKLTKKDSRENATPAIVKPQTTSNPEKSPPPDTKAEDKSADFQDNLFQTRFKEQPDIKLSPAFEQECLQYQSSNGISEDRIIKLANKDAFISAYAESKKRVSMMNYPATYGLAGGAVAFLAAKSLKTEPMKPALLSAGLAATAGLGVSLLITPWVARAEARALAYADDVGIKSYSQLGAHDGDGTGLPGGDLLAGALFGNILLKG